MKLINIPPNSNSSKSDETFQIDIPFNLELQKMLSGKQLLMEDLPFSLNELQFHEKKGFLQKRKGIAFTRKTPRCIRCNNKDPQLFAIYPCSRCKKECTYCRKCIMMGRVSSCTSLINWIGPPVAENFDPTLTWTGALSPGQQIASARVVEAINRHSELLLWAVCGAGKTEVLFAGIHQALLDRKRVCIATPRTDVVLELTPRLKTVFSDIPVASLYGGSEDRHLHAPLTIATTHQLIRFYEAFDAVILDEVDAFPYSVDETLQYAVRQARKPVSSMVYLTATPNEKWQQECRQGKRDFVTIPARYHRFSLPEPKFFWCGNWQKQLKKKKLPKALIHWLKIRLEKEKPILLFAPKIDLMEQILPILRTLHPKIESVHAEDPNRKEKVQTMRDKQVPLLLTTTILERGVTFPNLDVAVLGAEDRIFTESALVQIAGRVGRSANYPSGDIAFFHYGKTKSMIKAKVQIMNMNQEAEKKGLIDR